MIIINIIINIIIIIKNRKVVHLKIPPLCVEYKKTKMIFHTDISNFWTVLNK